MIEWLIAFISYLIQHGARPRNQLKEDLLHWPWSPEASLAYRPWLKAPPSLPGLPTPLPAPSEH